jgi:hypothetical protein
MKQITEKEQLEKSVCIRRKESLKVLHPYLGLSPRELLLNSDKKPYMLQVKLNPHY